MKTMFSDSAHGGAVRTGQPAWRRFVAIVLIALLSPVPALLAFWADANSDGQPDSWVDPLSGHVFTLAELNAFSDDIDGDGLSNSQEMAIGANPFSPDTDGDGISDLLDPLPLSTGNLSPANGIIWGAIALDDADDDGTPNFLDDYPFGQYGDQFGSPDMDGDGIPDFIDPAPWDYSNWSSVNGRQWLSDALADADGDGVPNFHDWYPDDSALWDPLQDPDGDGFVKARDPRPADPYNPSPVNGLNWGPDVYGDADSDGIPNFYDVYPYDSGNGYVPPEPDSDGDGIPDSVDPSPWDYDNFSAANGVSWKWDARGDADGDSISNFYDQFPYDYYNGNMPVSDMDGDGIPDAEDPAPTDPTNLSPINGGLWYTAALADADGDGNPNFTDPWPYDPTNGNLPPEWDSPSADTDGDGIPNAQDPALADPLNFSIYNGTSWYADAVGDIDGDGLSNFRDEHPYDYHNGYAGPDADGDGRPDSSDLYPNDPYDNADSDHDGIPDISDPAQSDPDNLSPINGYGWYGDVRGDADGDTILNFWDSEPYGPPPADADGDGLIDSVDPAPLDAGNFSAYNKASWSSSALGDADGDGIPNFFDTWPYDSLNGTGDVDMDGLPDASDPVPDDPYNNSPHNGAMWSGPSALGDVDNDGILNYFDAYPDDPYDGLPPGGDADGDGIPNEQDPDPRNGTNKSPYNGINWGEGANGDADNDGTANYWDPTPFGGDRDGDGIRDDLDPAPDDPTNYSEANQRAWYADALGDNDLDDDLNFYDQEPDGGMPYEPYLDEMPSASASPLVILNDGYDELGKPSAPGVTPARDLDDPELAIKGSDPKRIATIGLTPLHLILPPDYLKAGGSVTITQSGGEGSVRIHAVLTEGGVGVGEQPVVLGSVFEPSSDGTWTYWIEGVTVGPVTLMCHFPQRTFGGVDSEHPQGAMEDSVDEQIDLMVCSAHLSVDRDRDGKIDPGSYKDTTFPDRPFRFWVNDDDDSGEAGDAGGADIPGALTGWFEFDGRDPNYDDDVVNGSRDLVDFFAVYLDIKTIADLLTPADGYKFKIKHADAGVNFTYANLSFVEGTSYLKTPLTTGLGKDFAQSPATATTCQVTQDGVELDPGFINGIRFVGEGVILVECRSATDKPLVLFVEKDGLVVAELSINLSVCAIEEMFRHIDLTGFAREYDGGEITPPESPRETQTGVPPGLPDSEMNYKYFVFVHGYNIDAQNARGWNAEVFKRLYVLGSRARFVGVTWNGTPASLIPGFVSKDYPDYHKGVFHAFLTGDAMKSEFGKFIPGDADVTIAAHSLGNMCVSHSIQASGFRPARYFMINAAVPLEAYDLDSVDESQRMDMTEDDWRDAKVRPQRLFASNWHELFDANDKRSELTWKGLFRDVNDFTTLYNFYSPGEDVLENRATTTSAVLVNGLKDRGSWKIQELLKGVSVFTSLGNLVMERTQGGWDWNEAAYGIYSDVSSVSNEQLRVVPCFKPFKEAILIQPEVLNVVAPRIKYDVLARGIPALSHATGTRPVNIISSRNIDMQESGRNGKQWPTEGREADFVGKWVHSDFKNVALPCVSKMYKKLIDEGKLSD